MYLAAQPGTVISIWFFFIDTREETRDGKLCFFPKRYISIQDVTIVRF